MTDSQPPATHRDGDARERFERSRRDGANPKIEDYLDHAAIHDRAYLLRDLLSLEITIRREQGETPIPSEYRARFPEHPEAVENAFGPDPAATVAFNAPTNPDETIAFVSSKSKSPGGHDMVPVRGMVIGDYELIGEIARGGMGAVFRARHLQLGREVALKMILSGPFAGPEEVHRFLGEAVAAASLEHEQITTIYEVGEHLGYPYFTMQLVQGGSLSEHSERYRANPEASARLVERIARAVAYAHQRGFIHRDLKPSNILIDDREIPHIIDFGLAKRIDGGHDPGLTQHGVAVGTPSYMAPEQAGGRIADISTRTDVYGLGAILYELLAGRPPFRGRTVNETIMQVLEREPEPPRRTNPAAPRPLEMIALKCLDKRPDRRYPSAEALAADLDRYLQGEPVEAVRIDPREAIRRWIRRNPDLMARGLGIGSVLSITQLNYFLIPHPNPVLHLRLMMIELFWMVSTLLLGWLERRRPGSEPIRACWIGTDLAYATITLAMIEGAETPYVLGYTLLIVMSGIWNSTRLVWLTTVLAILGYLAIAYPRPPISNHHPNIIAALLLITGLVIANQVRRLRTLSEFRSRRLNR